MESRLLIVIFCDHRSDFPLAPRSRLFTRSSSLYSPQGQHFDEWRNATVIEELELARYLRQLGVIPTNVLGPDGATETMSEWMNG